jgi:hypothetical protein
MYDRSIEITLSTTDYHFSSRRAPNINDYASRMRFERLEYRRDTLLLLIAIRIAL